MVINKMGMDNTDATLKFAETLIYKTAGAYCSDLQRQILLTALQGERKTYDQLAKASGYSSRYVRQDVAPKLWQILSEALGQKVSKSNIRFLLDQKMNESSLAPSRSADDTPPPIVSLSTPIAKAISPPSAEHSLTTASILLVDDEPQNLRVLSDLLEEHGYRVRQAISGPFALDAIAQEKPALVLMDIHMPEMDGYSVCQRIKDNSTTEDIPVIFVSSLDEIWDKVKAFSVGGSDYISKPFKVVEVLARVENQLKLRRLQQTLDEQNRALQQALQRVQQLAATDEATQVASRRQFNQFLFESWQQGLEAQTPLTLMLCQIDNFKFEGEAATPRRMDDCLYQVAQAIKDAARDGLVCRYGVITFTVVLPQQTLAAGKTVAQAILQQMEKEAMAQRHSVRSIASQPLPLTLSIGLMTVHPTPEVDVEDALLKPCELLLQKAQGKGGNCWVS
ncbi:MAG: response regulator [Cyanobacteria bacterium P01_F01_bin.150]